MMSANVLIVSSSALVGYRLTDNMSLATIPLAAQLLATMLATIPASFVMRSLGRKKGFLIGCSIGLSGGVIATTGILQQNFVLFVAGVFCTGLFNGFGNYFRFAASEVAPKGEQSKAISYVMAGGVLASFIGANLANLLREGVANAEFAASYASLIAVYGIAFGLLLFVTTPSIKDAAFDSVSRSLKTIALQPSYRVALICAMFGYAVMGLVMTATPLAMKQSDFVFADTAFVIQWHVFCMFAPSFFTGTLIKRFGLLNILLMGAVLEALCSVINLTGSEFHHYWLSLMLLGLGWNFLFVGGTTLLVQTYAPQEAAKSQALNDVIVIATVTIASLSAGYLQQTFGWQQVNIAVLPFLVLVAGSVIWLKRQPAPITTAS